MGPKRAAASTSDAGERSRVKDKNAPKGPSNAYTIFYKHFHSEYQRKNPDVPIDGRQMTQLVAQAWKSLSNEEKKPFQERAQLERDKHASELVAYQKSDKYKQFVAHNQSVTKMGNVEIFSKEFLAFNKSREADLRALRRQISGVDEQIGDKNDKIDELKKKLDQSYKSLSSTKRMNFEKERQILIWCRELICALDKANLLEELELDYNTPAEQIIQTIDKASDDPQFSAKLKKVFSGFVLEIF